MSLDRRAPVFFLSYAHSTTRGTGNHPSPDDRVAGFFEQLSSHVGELLPGHEENGPGFVDRTLGGGERWTGELLHAVGTCQVFVALITPAYVRSRWCAMEWDAFARRPVSGQSAAVSPHGTTILPVSWIPVPKVHRVPAAVADVQLFTPNRLRKAEQLKDYFQDGLYGLLETHDDALYDEIVWQLARRIGDLVGQFHAEPRIPAGPDELGNIFREGESDDG